MAVTSWKLAGTGADNSGVGTLAWTNPSRITADDASFATMGLFFAGGETTHYLLATNFGFTSSDLPADLASIDGVEVEWQRKRSTGSPQPIGTGFTKYTLWNSGAIGTTKTDTTLWETTETAYVKGSSTDVWGASLTQAICTGSGFGAALWAKDDGSEPLGDPTLHVDAVRIRIYYTPAASGQPTIRRHGAANPSIWGGGKDGQQVFKTPGGVLLPFVPGRLLRAS